MDIFFSPQPEPNEAAGPAPVVKRLDERTVRQMKSELQLVDPVSAVKELVENSLDAGASSITVVLEDLGIEHIKVTDDGIGMSRESMALCCKRYYTSKIERYEDLAAWRGLGFKGEALASLVDVSESVIIISKTDTDKIANRFYYDRRGEVIRSDITPLAAMHGTIVSVKNIFKWYPARLSIIKREKARLWPEFVQLMREYSLAWPEVRFTLRSFSPDKPTFLSPAVPDGSLSTKVVDLFGPILEQLHHEILLPTDIQKILFPDGIKSVPCIDTGIKKVEMIIPKSKADPDIIFKTSPDRCFCFVNRRPVKLSNISKLVVKPLRTYFKVPSSKYPIFVLHLTLDPSSYDVNLSPDKKMIVLHEETRIENIISTVVQRLYPPSSPSKASRSSKSNLLTQESSAEIEDDEEQHGGKAVARKSTKQVDSGDDFDEASQERNISSSRKSDKSRKDSNQSSSPRKSLARRIASSETEDSTQAFDMPQGSSISSPASRNADLPRGEENESETTTTRKVAAPFEQLQLTPRNLAYAHVVGKLRPPLATAVIRLGSDLYICDQRRLLESVIYQRMLNTHHFPMKSLGSDTIELEPAKKEDDETTRNCWNVLCLLAANSEPQQYKRDIVRRILAMNGYNFRATCADGTATNPVIELVAYAPIVEDNLAADLRELLEQMHELLRRTTSDTALKKLHRRVCAAFDLNERFEDTVSSAAMLFRLIENKTPKVVSDFQQQLLQCIPRTQIAVKVLRDIATGLARRIDADTCSIQTIGTLLNAAACISPLKMDGCEAEWNMKCPHDRLCFQLLQVEGGF